MERCILSKLGSGTRCSCGLVDSDFTNYDILGHYPIHYYSYVYFIRRSCEGVYFPYVDHFSKFKKMLFIIFIEFWAILYKSLANSLKISTKTTDQKSFLFGLDGQQEADFKSTLPQSIFVFQTNSFCKTYFHFHANALFRFFKILKGLLKC